MANIYVVGDGKYDHSRWLDVSYANPGTVLFELADLCQPGRVSALSEISLEVGAVRSVIRNGAVQVTTGRGYFVMRRVENEITMEFRSHDDGASVRIAILCDDLAGALNMESCERRASAL